MKLLIKILALFILLSSCNGLVDKNEKISFFEGLNKRNEIDHLNIFNKKIITQTRKNKSLKISDQNEISELLGVLKNSEQLNKFISFSNNNGSIIIDFVDNSQKSIIYLSIVYTKNNGALIRNDLNGKKFINNQFIELIEEKLEFD